MSTDKKDVSRREFLRQSTATGTGVWLAANGLALERCRRPEPEGPTEPTPASPASSTLDTGPVPTRPFGRTGVDVPVLSLSTRFDAAHSTLLQKRALRYGITYWDTAQAYRGGAEERGIGTFVKRWPETRERLFLVTRATETDPRTLDLDRELDVSLERLQMPRVDYYQLHGVDDPDFLTPGIRAWAERAKRDGRIGLFGFSTHKNMAPLLEASAKLGWIDAIMLAYNYRLLRDADMNRALDAAYRAGIGLTAMKFRGLGTGHAGSDSGDPVADGLKLQAVLSDPRISSVCTFVPNVETLDRYVSAARSGPPSPEEMRGLHAHAERNRSSFCAGCAHVCEPVAGGAPIADVARFVMYHRSYGRRDRARHAFAGLSSDARELIATVDYEEATRQCPNGVSIAGLMQEARALLA